MINEFFSFLLNNVFNITLESIFITYFRNGGMILESGIINEIRNEIFQTLRIGVKHSV